MLERLQTKIFADGADVGQIATLAEEPYIRGFTTNPTLMRKAGVPDYVEFAQRVLQLVTDLPVSFEVFTDELDEMVGHGQLIAGWGSNVYVKIPITNTRGESTTRVIRELSSEGVKVNVTAMLTAAQVETAAGALSGGPPGYASIFAGRIADTGRDPVPIMREALGVLESVPDVELIWASPRQLRNVIEADEIGCHIITVTEDLLAKIHLLGKDLDDYSLDTVRMFYGDAQSSGFSLEEPAVRR
jgi:transaldolase